MSHWMTSGKARLKAKQKNTFAARAKVAASAANFAALMTGVVQMPPTANVASRRRRRPRFQRGINPMLARGDSVPVPSRFQREGAPSVAEASYQHYSEHIQQQPAGPEAQQRRQRIQDPANSFYLRNSPPQQPIKPSTLGRSAPTNIHEPRFPNSFDRVIVSESLSTMQPPSLPPNAFAAPQGVPRFQRQQRHKNLEFKTPTFYHSLNCSPPLNIPYPQGTGNGIPRFRRSDSYKAVSSKSSRVSPYFDNPMQTSYQLPIENYSSSFVDGAENMQFTKTHHGRPLHECTNMTPQSVSNFVYLKNTNTHNVQSSRMAKSTQPYGSWSLLANNPQQFGQQSPAFQGFSAGGVQRLRQLQTLIHTNGANFCQGRGNSSFGNLSEDEESVFHFTDSCQVPAHVSASTTKARFKSNPFRRFAFDDQQSITAFRPTRESNSMSLAPSFSGKKRPWEHSNFCASITSRQRLGDDVVSVDAHHEHLKHQPVRGIACFQNRQPPVSNDTIDKAILDYSVSMDTGLVEQIPFRQTHARETYAIQPHSPAPFPLHNKSHFDRPDNTFCQGHMPSSPARPSTPTLTVIKLFQRRLFDDAEENVTSNGTEAAPIDIGKTREEVAGNECPQTLLQENQQQRSSLESSNSTTDKSSGSSSVKVDQLAPVPSLHIEHHQQKLQTQPSRPKTPQDLPRVGLSQPNNSNAQSRKRDWLPATQRATPPMLQFFNNGVKVNLLGEPLSRPASPLPANCCVMQPLKQLQHSPGLSTISSHNSIGDVLLALSGKSLWELSLL